MYIYNVGHLSKLYSRLLSCLCKWKPEKENIVRLAGPVACTVHLAPCVPCRDRFSKTIRHLSYCFRTPCHIFCCVLKISELLHSNV